MAFFHLDDISIAHPSEKGGYNLKAWLLSQPKSIAHPSEKGGYNSLFVILCDLLSIAHPSEKGGYNLDEVKTSFAKGKTQRGL